MRQNNVGCTAPHQRSLAWLSSIFKVFFFHREGDHTSKIPQRPGPGANPQNWFHQSGEGNKIEFRLWISLTSFQALGHLTQEHGPASLHFPLSGQNSSSGHDHPGGPGQQQFTSLPGQYASLPGQFGSEGGYHQQQQQPTDPIQVRRFHCGTLLIFLLSTTTSRESG